MGGARESDRRRHPARDRRSRVRAIGIGGPTRDPTFDARMEDSGAEHQQESLSGTGSAAFLTYDCQASVSLVCTEALGALDFLGPQQLHLPCEYRTGSACVVAKELN